MPILKHQTSRNLLALWRDVLVRAERVLVAFCLPLYKLALASISHQPLTEGCGGRYLERGIGPWALPLSD